MNASSTSKKVVLSLGLILISAAYVVWLRMTSPTAPVATTPTTPTTTTVTTPVGTTPIRGEDDDYVPVLANPTPGPTTSIPAPVAGTYTNGSYTGTAVDAYYGTVQVKAIISGGRLTDVQILQAPSDRDTSSRITSQAMPILTQEAISAQSAQVSIVSGATQTSQGFIDSLTSALAQAKS